MKSRRKEQLKLQRKLLELAHNQVGNIIRELVLDPLTDIMLFGSAPPYTMWAPEEFQPEPEEDHWDPCPLLDDNQMPGPYRKVGLAGAFMGIPARVDEALPDRHSYVFWAHLGGDYRDIIFLESGERKWVLTSSIESLGLRDAFAFADADFAPEFDLDEEGEGKWIRDFLGED